MYDILHSSMPQEDKWPALQKFKEKIVKLHAERLKTMLLDNDEKGRMDSEEPNLYHVLKMQKDAQHERSKRCRTPLATYMKPPKESFKPLHDTSM